MFNHKVRSIEEVHVNGGDFYKNIIDERHGFLDCVKEAYEGFEHWPPTDHRLDAKIPNVTRLWNLPFNSGGFMYGSSMGHVHKKYDFDVQEIYEFLNFGAMLIASNKDRAIRMHVCEPGDKVAVPPDCMMTILNLSFDELVTLDMANPYENESTKEVLIEERRGPMLALYHTSRDTLNSYSTSHFCSSFLSHRFNDRVVLPLDGIVRMKLNKKYSGIYNVPDADVGLDFIIGSDNGDLADEILKHKDGFASCGIDVVKAESSVGCIGRDKDVHWIYHPLERLVTSSDRNIYDIFGMNSKSSKI